jgi:hypothetical protein
MVSGISASSEPFCLSTNSTALRAAPPNAATLPIDPRPHHGLWMTASASGPSPAMARACPGASSEPVRAAEHG